jgi:hypothetical protein
VITLPEIALLNPGSEQNWGWGSRAFCNQVQS